MLRCYGFELIGDVRLNVYNSLSRKLYAEAGIAEATLSAELTLPQARDVGGYAVTLGRVPLMITERCFIKDNFSFDMCSTSSLTDRKGVKFPMMRTQDHRNLILNSSVTYMADKSAELKKAATVAEYFLFTTETV